MKTTSGGSGLGILDVVSYCALLIHAFFLIYKLVYNWGEDWYEEICSEHVQGRRGIERALYGVDDSRHGRSLIDYVRVFPAGHQDVENPFGQGCERINTHPI